MKSPPRRPPSDGLRFVLFGVALVIVDRAIIAIEPILSPVVHDLEPIALLLASVVGLLYLFRGWNSGKRSPVISVVDQIAGYRSRLEILSAIATQSTAGMPVESIIDQTLQLMHQHFPDIRSSYGSLNESGFFLFVASVNPPGMPDLEHPDVDLQHIAPDYLTRLRKNNLLIIPDIAKEALPEVLMERLRYTNTNALLVVPVQHSDQLLGLLTLQVSKPHEWTEIEITIAREVAEHLAIAIHDANELQERQHTDVALQRSEELYRLIAENSTDMISKRTSDGHITYVSPACRSLLGYEPEELVGQNAYQFYHPDDLQMVLTALEPVFHSATVTTATYRIRRKDGRYIWFETRSQGIDNAENGKLQEIICSSRDVTERHEAQARLQESEIRFQQMNATIDDLFWFSEQRLTKLIYVSPALKKIWGLEVEAVLRDPQIWWATVHPDDLPVIRGIMQNANNKEFTAEYRIFRTDGAMRWIAMHGYPIADETGKIFRYAGVCQDITEKKHSQATEGEQRLFAEALSRSAQTLNSTLNLQEVLARVIDSVVTVLPPCDLAHVYLLEGGVAYLSRSHAYTEIGKAWENTNPKLDIPSLPNLLKTITDLQPSVISDTRDYPQWIVLPGAEGVRSVVAAAIILDDIAIGLMILNSVVPGTYLPFHGERLQAFANQASIAIRNARLYEEVQHYVDQLELRVGERTAELLETNERLQVILETTAEGICYTRDAKIQYANRAFYELLGYSGDDPGGFVELWGTDVPWEDDSKLKTALIHAQGNYGTWRGEMQLHRRDGSEFSAGITISWVSHSGIDADEAVTILRDISQEKSLEAQRDRFIANASHELRTPLTNLKLRLYLLRKQPEFLNDHLRVMELVSENMHNLVDDLLDMTRFERGLLTLKKQPTALQTLIEDVTTVLQAECDEKQISLVSELPLSPVTVQVDRHRMNQVITNLIVNAIHYSNSGDEIRVSLGIVQQNGQPFATLQICDTGIGIAPEMQERVFEPFVRASENGESGTGLGLTIVREIITLHGGSIKLDSALGEGSTFTVLLPLAE